MRTENRLRRMAGTALLVEAERMQPAVGLAAIAEIIDIFDMTVAGRQPGLRRRQPGIDVAGPRLAARQPAEVFLGNHAAIGVRSEEHTSELQSLMRISYAVFCLKKKN